MKKAGLLFIGILLFIQPKGYSQVLINEFMSNNQSVIHDADGDYADWIELYNSGITAVNLQGYGLSDQVDTLHKWQFPSRVMNPGTFLLIWCSGKNSTIAGFFHTNFSLNAQGESFYLSDSSGNILDYYNPVFLPADKSFGRIPDGSAFEYVLSQPTPGSTNNSAIPLSGVLSDQPTFSIPGGLFRDSLYLSLSDPDPGITIRYTLDGSDPTVNSAIFTSPLLINNRSSDTNVYSMIRTCYKVHPWMPDWHPPLGNVFKATVVRAQAFKAGYLPGPIITNTYFIDDSIFGRYGNLPVISIVSDPKNLFNDTTGIYVPGITYQPSTFLANYYLDWDRPANIEMYLPDGRLAFNSIFKININGQSSPSSPQKGINVNATTDYGISKVNYPLFENTNGPAKYITQFDKFKIRAWGSDRNRALIRDAYSTQFMAHTQLDYEAYRPCVVFIDGEYWGLQELRERDRDGSYLKSHYLIDSKNPGFDILDASDSSVFEGDKLKWNALTNYVRSNSLADSANYEYVKTQMDVNSCMLHYLFSVYFSRADWPYQNEAVWRPRTADGKFKWLMWDMDNTVAYYVNPWYDMFQQTISGNRGYGPSEILDDLLANTEFKNNWINLFADFMNTEFLPQLMQAQVDSMKAPLVPYFNEFQDRWQVNYNWQAQLDSMKWWVNLRPQYCRQHIRNQFSIQSDHVLTLNVSDTLKGKMKVNTVKLDETTPRVNQHTFPWNGTYFDSIPVPLHAIARPGYKFIKWLETNDTNSVLLIYARSDTAFTALFDIDSAYKTVKNPVINEIMASNTTAITDNYGEHDDWIEIYNPNDDTLDIGGWYLTNHLILPTRFHLATGNDSTKIPPYGFLLLWADDNSGQGILHLNFKLSSSGDFVALFHADGETLADSMSFGIQNPDVSYGRMYDASQHWTAFISSTPQRTNVNSPAGRIFINEVMTNNSSVTSDEYGQFESWIELYNPNPDTIDLAGWFLTDSLNHPQKFRIAFGHDSTKIQPFGFKILWADDQPDQGILHLNMLLDNSSSCVQLYKPDHLTRSDSVCFGNIPGDQSFGRRSDGDSVWVTFVIPTPDSNNVDLTLSLQHLISPMPLEVYPNPVASGKIYFNQTVNLRLYDVTGRCCRIKNDCRELNIAGLEKGIYLLRTEWGETDRIVIQ